MSWKPIVVGVDGSPESARAAVTGAAIARRMGTASHLVSAVPDYQRLMSSSGLVPDLAETVRGIHARDRDTIIRSLQDRVPARLAQDLEISAGAPPLVLAESARRFGAGVIVLGHRQHHGLDRLRGSIVRHLIRTCDVPLLVAAGDPGAPIERVLVALDLSYASQPALDTARHWADLFGARLRAVHVVEPMPMLPGDGVVSSEAWYRNDELLRETGTWASLDARRAEKVVRTGHAIPTLAREAAEWRADLLILASHGRGWVNRLLVGSTSEALLDRPPTMTLVVPAAKPVAESGVSIAAA